VTIQEKTTEQYFHVVLFIVLYNFFVIVVLASSQLMVDIQLVPSFEKIKKASQNQVSLKTCMSQSHVPTTSACDG